MLALYQASMLLLPSHLQFISGFLIIIITTITVDFRLPGLLSSRGSQYTPRLTQGILVPFYILGQVGICPTLPNPVFQKWLLSVFPNNHSDRLPLYSSSNATSAISVRNLSFFNSLVSLVYIRRWFPQCCRHCRRSKTRVSCKQTTPNTCSATRNGWPVRSVQNGFENMRNCFSRFLGQITMYLSFQYSIWKLLLYPIK